MTTFLEAKYAEGADAEAMARGSHYDYIAQCWVDGHDHAHCSSSAQLQTIPLMFCGADLATCMGGAQ